MKSVRPHGTFIPRRSHHLDHVTSCYFARNGETDGCRDDLDSAMAYLGPVACAHCYLAIDFFSSLGSSLTQELVKKEEDIDRCW